MTKSSGHPAYQALYEAIASGALKPGERLRELELANRVGVSRTPIRDAIRRLEMEGIVSHEPHIGAVIRTLSQQEIVELYEMRIVLETTASRMAARHASDAEIRTLISLNAEIQSTPNDPNIVADLNRQFHGCILSASRNRYLVTSYQALSNVLILLGATTLNAPDRVQTVIEQHSDIIRALQARDSDKAAQAMATHMETSLDYRLKGLTF